MLRGLTLFLLLAALPLHAHAQNFTAPALSDPEQRALQDARMHEARGDEARAFEAYRSFLQSDRDAVDIALRFAAMARARMGLAPAQALLREMSGTPALRLATAMLTEISGRRKALETFVTAHPNYGPAYALLAAEYAQQRFEDQPLRDRLRERELISRFLGFDQKGELSASFVDATVLATWLERAERRLTALDSALSGAAAAPTAKFTRSNSSWIVYLNMPEQPTEISYRIGKGPWISTGEAGSIDMRTGRKMANVHFLMPLDTPPTTIELTYRDIGGRESGPHAIAFNPHETVLRHARETLDAEFPGWVQFSDGETNRDWVYFNTLLMTRCAIKAAEYGFDGPPSTAFPLPPCDLRDPSRMPSDAQSAVKMGPHVKLVSVRLTFTDGTTETRSYRRRLR